MIRTERITVRLLICMLLLLTSCNSYSDDEMPHNEFSHRFTPLRVDTVDGLAEIGAWEIMGRGNAISLVKHNLVLNRLTVISEQIQKIVLFAIEKEETIAQQIVDIPNLRVLDIDEVGDKLLVAMAGRMRNDQGKPRDFFHWVGIWSVASGSLDECLSGSCIDEMTDPDHIEKADIGAVMDAETVVAYDEYSYRFAILSPENGGGISLINSPDSDYWWHIGKIALNSNRSQLAIVFQEGRIVLEKISEHNNWPLKGFEVLEKGVENSLQPIQNVVFDQSGKWLSIIRGKRLSIWSVSGWIKKETFSDQIDDVQEMKFNPSGELLFIMIDDHIRIIGLEEEKVVFELHTPGITSLDISDDNRLLFWGDENGTVHVWGIPVRE